MNINIGNSNDDIIFNVRNQFSGAGRQSSSTNYKFPALRGDQSSPSPSGVSLENRDFGQPDKKLDEAAEGGKPSSPTGGGSGASSSYGLEVAIAAIETAPDALSALEPDAPKSSTGTGAFSLPTPDSEGAEALHETPADISSPLGREVSNAPRETLVGSSPPLNKEVSIASSGAAAGTGDGQAETVPGSPGAAIFDTSQDPLASEGASVPSPLPLDKPVDKPELTLTLTFLQNNNNNTTKILDEAINYFIDQINFYGFKAHTKLKYKIIIPNDFIF
jgi:hypothetical protein